MQEAKACVEIKKTLLEKGYTTPLIADIHFAPKVAMTVAECFDKIRVNPGNFADGRKKFEDICTRRMRSTRLRFWRLRRSSRRWS